MYCITTKAIGVIYSRGLDSHGINMLYGYADATQYFKNDLVTTGSAPNLNLYMNINDHLSNGANITDGTEVANWQTIISGQFTTSSIFIAQSYFFGTMN